MGEEDLATASAVGMEPADLESMYRLLAIAKYEDRYVIPQAHTELAQRLAELPGTCGLDFEGGPGNCGALPRPAETLNQNFMLTQKKGSAWKPLPMVEPGAVGTGR